MLLECRFLPDDTPAEIAFDLPQGPLAPNSYVRAEFYEVEGELPYYGYAWRNWKSLRLLSNPIYLTEE